MLTSAIISGLGLGQHVRADQRSASTSTYVVSSNRQFFSQGSAMMLGRGPWATPSRSTLGWPLPPRRDHGARRCARCFGAVIDARSLRARSPTADRNAWLMATVGRRDRARQCGPSSPSARRPGAAFRPWLAGKPVEIFGRRRSIPLQARHPPWWASPSPSCCRRCCPGTRHRPRPCSRWCRTPDRRQADGASMCASSSTGVVHDPRTALA